MGRYEFVDDMICYLSQHTSQLVSDDNYSYFRIRIPVCDKPSHYLVIGRMSITLSMQDKISPLSVVPPSMVKSLSLLRPHNILKNSKGGHSVVDRLVSRLASSQMAYMYRSSSALRLP